MSPSACEIADCGYERVVGSIYEGTMSDRPWRDTMDACRSLFSASNFALRIIPPTIDAAESIIASCTTVSDQVVRAWENHHYGHVTPQLKAVGGVMKFLWEDRLPQSPALASIHESEGSRMMMNCFDLRGKMEFQVMASRPRSASDFTDREV